MTFKINRDWTHNHVWKKFFTSDRSITWHQFLCSCGTIVHATQINNLEFGIMCGNSSCAKHLYIDKNILLILDI